MFSFVDISHIGAQSHVNSLQVSLLTSPMSRARVAQRGARFELEQDPNVPRLIYTRYRELIPLV
jgi:hypothetical protein